jgi:hypothetical protein
MATNTPKEVFSWDKTGLDESTFSAMSSLVSLRKGGQVNLSVADVAGGEGQAIRSTSHAERMSEDMKRKFVDAISELIAMHGTAAQVSSAALVEDSGKITFVVARNDGFDHEDKRTIIDVFAQLEEHSRVGQSYKAVC